MANPLKKNKALLLRQKGLSIGEISVRLSVPKSTVSVWCRDIKLTALQIIRLQRKMAEGSYAGRMKFLETIRAKRKSETIRLRKEGLKEVGSLSNRDLFIGGIAMYCSEGTTSPSNEQVSFSNSDPRMILYMIEWFKKICGVSAGRFTIQVRINKIHSKRAGEIERYWSRLTKIPLNQFTKIILIKAKQKKIYLKPNDYYGTVRIMARQGTALRRKILGWIDGLMKMPG